MSESPKCPACGSEKTSWVGYSCPAQATCGECGRRYEFGKGIRIIRLAEGISLRPQLYANLKCSVCSGYKVEVDDPKNWTEEDLAVVCKCEPFSYIQCPADRSATPKIGGGKC